MKLGGGVRVGLGGTKGEYNQNNFIQVQNPQRINKNHSLKKLHIFNPKDVKKPFLWVKSKGHFGS